MWGSFFAGSLACAIMAYALGYVLLRAFKVGRIVAFCCAPFATTAVAGVLCTVYPKLGVDASLLSVWVAPFVVATLLRAVSRSLWRGPSVAFWEAAPERPRGAHSRSLPLWRSPAVRDAGVLTLYVAAGLVVASVFFLGNLGSPVAFEQEFDNLHHLGVTNTYVQSGNWSPFSATLYSTAADAAINPLPSEGYYPSAWNMFCALVICALNTLSLPDATAPLAANVVNFVFASMVYPSGMFLLMRTVFAEKPGVVLAGALCTPAFFAFPWYLLVFGPLYPNMTAFCALPAVAVCFIALIGPDMERRARVAGAALFLVGVVAFAFMQPNAVFSAAVLLAAYCVYRSTFIVEALDARRARAGKPSARMSRTARKALIAFAAVCLVGVIWLACFRLPPLRSVVWHCWPAFQTFAGGVENCLLLAYRSPNPQYILAALVIVGGVYTCVRRRYLWLGCSYAFACFIYVVAAATDTVIKYVVAGFWYTDTARIAATAAIIAVPLASLGLWCAARALCASVRRIAKAPRARQAAQVAITGAVAAAFACVNFYPAAQNPAAPTQSSSAFGEFGSWVSDLYSVGEAGPYDAEEMAFVQEAKALVPNDALILNMPDDGSAFAYVSDNLHVYYRYLRTYGEDDETPESRIIRTELSSYASNPEVRAAVDEVGATYVLLLDQGESGKPRTFLFTYNDGALWQGLSTITDDTPGFDVVLSRGDMRLYRINPEETIA